MAADILDAFFHVEVSPHRGEPRRDRMPDISFEHGKSNAAFGKALVSRLAPLAASGLSHEEALTLAILRKEAQQLVEAPRYYWLTFPVTPYSFRGLGVHQALAAHAFRNREDGSRYLVLLEGYAAFIHALKARLEEQARRGIVLAKEEIPLAANAFAAAAREGARWGCTRTPTTARAGSPWTSS